MKKITYAKLMKMIEEGDACICSSELTSNFIILETYDRQGRAVRKEVEVTSIPANVQIGA